MMKCRKKKKKERIPSALGHVYFIAGGPDSIAASANLGSTTIEKKRRDEKRKSKPKKKGGKGKKKKNRRA